MFWGLPKPARGKPIDIWEDWGTSVYSGWVSPGTRVNCLWELLDELVCWNNSGSSDSSYSVRSCVNTGSSCWIRLESSSKFYWLFSSESTSSPNFSSTLVQFRFGRTGRIDSSKLASLSSSSSSSKITQSSSIIYRFKLKRAMKSNVSWEGMVPVDSMTPCIGASDSKKSVSFFKRMALTSSSVARSRSIFSYSTFLDRNSTPQWSLYSVLWVSRFCGLSCPALE